MLEVALAVSCAPDRSFATKFGLRRRNKTLPVCPRSIPPATSTLIYRFTRLSPGVAFCVLFVETTIEPIERTFP